MIDDRELFDRAIQRFVPPERSFDRLVRRRELKRRNRRIAATVVALGLFVAIVASFAVSIELRRSQPLRQVPTPFHHNGEIAVFQDILKGGAPHGGRLVSIDPVSGQRVTLPISVTKPWGPSGSPEPSWSPDGSSVAFVFAHRLLGILDVTTGQSRDVASCGFCFGSPAWSPDGSTIAVGGSPDGAIGLFEVGTSAATMLQPLGDAGAVTSLAWSPDGQRIAFIFQAMEGGTELYTIRRDGSDLRAIAQDALFSVTWSPDGSTIAYLVSPHYYTGCYPISCPIVVNVVDADGSTPRTLFSAGKFSYLIFEPGLAWSPDGTRLALTLPSHAFGGLYVISSHGTGLRLLLRGAYGRPSWRPVP
jgi:Tol biopolymer transport system component